MGNIISCKKCDVATAGSVVNLSDDCMKRLRGLQTKEKKNSTVATLLSDDAIRAEKLRCIDDYHSEVNGLTTEEFEFMCHKIESRADEEDEIICSRQTTKTCLQRNKDCMSKCKEQMQEFIDCIDIGRIITIKRRLNKEKEKEQNKNLQHVENLSTKK